MPVDIISNVLVNGVETIPHWEAIRTYAPIVIGIGTLKYYFRGAMSTWERDMHGKVYLVTGGTSGMGAEVVRSLAERGAQIVLLVRSIEDSWLVEHIDDLRNATNNFMIYAEQCDLSSLYSVRKFATKWLDNKPPRRLDGVICCAAETLPRGKPRQLTQEGVESQIGINYLAHYHLINLLSPSIRSQPPDRDVRVIFVTCSSQSLGEVDLNDLLWESKKYPQQLPWRVYGTSKLMLGLFSKEYQKRVDQYERKDKAPCNVKVNIVNPGLMRSPSTRRFLSMGSVWGLLLYLVMYPLYWIVFKNTYEGAQSIFFALWAPILLQEPGGNLIQECKIITPARYEYQDEELQAKVFDKTDDLITKLEKKSAIERKKQEKSAEAKKSPEQKKQEAEAARQEELKRQQNIYEKPNSTEELETKLNFLKSLLGHGDMPLFPDDIGKSKEKK